MNFKILSFAAATLLALVSGQPTLPECSVGTDTEACTTPFGDAGYFVHKVMDEETSSLLRQGNGRFGGRGHGRGPRLTQSKCVPMDGLEEGMGPFGGDMDGDGEIDVCV